MNMQKEKLATELEMSRKQNQIYEHKVKRMEEELSSLKENLSNTDKENKMLKKQNISILEQLQHDQISY